MKNIRQPVRAGAVPAAAATAAPVTETSSPTAPPETPADKTDLAKGQTDTETAEAEEEVEGRVLVGFEDYHPNDIFVGSAEDALALEVELKIDCDPKAVAYAKSLQD